MTTSTITKLDGSSVDVVTLTHRLNRTIRLTCLGLNGETFGDVVVDSLRARQDKNLPVCPCDLRFKMKTKHGMRSAAIRRQVEVWHYLVKEGITDRKWNYHTFEDETEDSPITD